MLWEERGTAWAALQMHFQCYFMPVRAIYPTSPVGPLGPSAKSS